MKRPKRGIRRHVSFGTSMMLFTMLPTLPAGGVTVRAQESARVNQGIYGGKVKDMAWDEENGVVWAAVEGALSVFHSTDSGRTWEATYDEDSLKFQRDGRTVGWGGGGRTVSSDDGISVAMNAEEGGSLHSAVITTDGGESGHTIYDAALVEDIRAQLSGVIHENRNLGLCMVKTCNGVVYMSSGNILLASEDSAQTWEVCAGFPDTSVIAADMSPGEMWNINDVVPIGDSRDSVFALVDEGVGSEVQRVFVTLNGGETFEEFPVCDTTGLSDELPKTKTVWVDTAEYVEEMGTVLDTVGDSVEVEMVDSLGRRCMHIKKLFVVGDALLAWEQSVTVDGDVEGLNALHVSTDRGEHWSRVFAESPGNNLGEVSVFEDASFDNGYRIVAGARYSDSLGPGDSWQDMAGVDPSALGDVPSRIVLHIPGTDIYLGTSNAGVWRTDGGIDGSFELAVEGLEAVTIYDIAQDESNLDKVVLATRSGIAVTRSYTDGSVDYADKWHGDHGSFPMLMGGLGYTVVGINPFDTAEVWAGNGNGLRRAESNALEEASWSPPDQGKFGMAMGGTYTSNITDLDFEAYSIARAAPTSIAFYAADTILVSLAGHGPYGGVIRSNNGGDDWFMDTALPDTACNVVAVAEDGSGNKIIYAGFGNESAGIGGALYKSSDAAETWTLLEGPVEKDGDETLPVYDIAACNGHADSIVVAAGRCVAFSTNGGDSLHCVPPLQSDGVDMNQPMTSLSINKNDPDSVYVAQGKNVWLLNMSPSMIMDSAETDPCSEDSCWGDSCRIVCCKDDSCDTAVVDTAHPPKEPDGLLPRLSLYHTGYPGEIVYAVHYDALTMTSSTGFYEIERNAASEPHNPVSVRTAPAQAIALRSRIMPNPFSNAVRISYRLPHAMNIRAALYRPDGKVLVTLHDGKAPAGLHVHRLCGEQLGTVTGLLLLRLDGGSVVHVDRLLRVK